MRDIEATSFLNPANVHFISELYARYTQDASSVASDWVEFFEGLGDDERDLLADVEGTSWAGQTVRVVGAKNPSSKPKEKKTGGASKEDILKSIKLKALLQAHRIHGHKRAKLDPLGFATQIPCPELDPEYYGIEDLDDSVFVAGEFGLEETTVEDALKKVRALYCGPIGYEFFQVEDPEERDWLQQKAENIQEAVVDKESAFKFLTRVDGFEGYLKTKFVGAKRFGVEGGDTSVLAIKEVIDHSSTLGLKDVVIGMAHRGRLNVLTNIMGKSYTAMLSEFQGTPAIPEDAPGAGDVKYHLGFSSDKDFRGGKVHLSLAYNPSHLEAVNPVVMGKVRARQRLHYGVDRTKSMPILIHGDAAFSGQGVVPEALMMSGLDGYTVGGTVHIIVNNQIGFTTDPKDSRTTDYCSDVAQSIRAPIFHVNGDDAEAVMRVSQIAAEYRQKFQKDVVIDLVCYRRHGHNESDEPAFTQPKMYEKINKHPSPQKVFASNLMRDGVLTDEQIKKIEADFKAEMDEAFEAAKTYKPNRPDWLELDWGGIRYAGPETTEEEAAGKTGVDLKILKEVGEKISTIPEGFAANKKIARQFDAKKEMLKSGEGFDWAMGEGLAYGALLQEGSDIRMTGQDVERGTFSHRHCVITSQEGEKYSPFGHISDDQGRFVVHNSFLSEFAVLGFEYGYSIANPKPLVIWEAQFGDFSNGAQIIIDQFISSAESKWLRMSGLVMQLPHGYEGQGPEHSSARPERYLQMCAEYNMQVVNCSTPANFFHALRRQVCRDFRKPLIVMSPKSLLRHKRCVSSLEDFGPKTKFQTVIGDDKASKDVKRVVLCTGKVYYDLLERLEEDKIKDVALVRVEQLYPFPQQSLLKELKKYKNAEIIWCQEEPKNMGYWSSVRDDIEDVLTALGQKNARAQFIGREAAASPATGFASRHAAEQKALVEQALKIK